MTFGFITMPRQDNYIAANTGSFPNFRQMMTSQVIYFHNLK